MTVAERIEYDRDMRLIPPKSSQITFSNPYDTKTSDHDNPTWELDHYNVNHVYGFTVKQMARKAYDFLNQEIPRHRDYDKGIYVRVIESYKTTPFINPIANTYPASGYLRRIIYTVETREAREAAKAYWDEQRRIEAERRKIQLAETAEAQRVMRNYVDTGRGLASGEIMSPNYKATVQRKEYPAPNFVPLV